MVSYSLWLKFETAEALMAWGFLVARDILEAPYQETCVGAGTALCRHIVGKADGLGAGQCPGWTRPRTSSLSAHRSPGCFEDVGVVDANWQTDASMLGSGTVYNYTLPRRVVPNACAREQESADRPLHQFRLIEFLHGRQTVGVEAHAPR